MSNLININGKFYDPEKYIGKVITDVENNEAVKIVMYFGAIPDTEFRPFYVMKYTDRDEILCDYADYVIFLFED